MVENSGVEMSCLHKVKGHFNPGLFKPRLFNHELFNSMVQKFMVEKSGVERSGLKLGVEKSGVEMSFNRLRAISWKLNQLLGTLELKQIINLETQPIIRRVPLQTSS